MSSRPVPGRRRGGARRWVLALPPVLALVELAGILLVGSAIGAGWTLLLLAVAAAAGALLLVRGGVGGLRRAAEHGRTGRPAGRELVDAGLLGLGALLLLLPGFVSDVLGLLCVLPPTRPLVRRLLGRLLGTAVLRAVGLRRGDLRRGDVVTGEVVVPPDVPQGWRPPRSPRAGQALEGTVLPPPDDDEPPRHA